jgi:hypothetical protein
MLELLGDLRDLRSETVIAHFFCHVHAVTGHAEAARENFIARLLEDGNGFSRQQGFVDLEMV